MTFDDGDDDDLRNAEDDDDDDDYGDDYAWGTRRTRIGRIYVIVIVISHSQKIIFTSLILNSYFHRHFALRECQNDSTKSFWHSLIKEISFFLSMFVN